MPKYDRVGNGMEVKRRTHDNIKADDYYDIINIEIVFGQKNQRIPRFRMTTNVIQK